MDDEAGEEPLQDMLLPASEPGPAEVDGLEDLGLGSADEDVTLGPSNDGDEPALDAGNDADALLPGDQAQLRNDASVPEPLEAAAPGQQEGEEAGQEEEPEPAASGDEIEPAGDEYEEEEDDNASVQQDEAEVEVRKKKGPSDREIRAALQEEARALIARMEQAMQKDAQDLAAGSPATRKLQMLKQVRAPPVVCNNTILLMMWAASVTATWQRNHGRGMLCSFCCLLQCADGATHQMQATGPPLSQGIQASHC